MIPAEPAPEYPLPARVVHKARAIVEDAGQFWLVILICLVCPSIASIFTAPWYFVRLWQWHSLARNYPWLLQPDAPGSLPDRFQRAKWKLLAGMCVGIITLGVIGVLAASGILG
jgi:hypothetical protein